MQRAPEVTVSLDVTPKLLAEGLAIRLRDMDFLLVPGGGDIAIVDGGACADSSIVLKIAAGDKVIVRRRDVVEEMHIAGVDDLLLIVEELAHELTQGIR